MNLIYAGAKIFVRFALRLYYHKINVEGLENIPKDTPLLVIPNHQNALIDPLLVGAFIPRSLHYLTRADVFNKRTTPFLRKLNMLPIYRIRDGYATLSKNDQIFEACYQVFKQNQSVLIFAEGNHGEEYFLRPLTKGAARIALNAQSQLSKDLQILPVGLNFFEHRKPQSTVIVKFGKPLSVRKYLGEFKNDKVKGLKVMRDAIAESMKSTLVIPDETDDYHKRKRKIFQRKNEKLSFDELRHLDVQDLISEEYPKRKHWIAKILNPLPYFLITQIINKEKDIVFHSTRKFAAGIITLPLWWGLVFLILFFTAGIKIAILAVIVMITGLFYSYQR